ncbi:MAG: RNA methyltransferase [Clostridia bacterium]|nr:RNA methyltransferase [Clostridia bacterium]
MIKDITSTNNATFKLIKSLKTKKGRQSSGMYAVEGIKSVRDAIESGCEISLIAVSDKLTEHFDFDEIYRVSDKIFAGLCDTDTPQGVIAVIKKDKTRKNRQNGDLCLYCDRVTDPGNMGTIIRICDAVGADLMISTECADIYSPKTVRASMGSFFHINIAENVTYKELENMKSDGFTILAGALTGDTCDYGENVYGKKTVIVVGNEANGVSDEVLKICDKSIKIPIFGKAESLNVAVAAALMLYKAREFNGNRE